MAINRVDYYGETLIDLTADTVTPSDVRAGVTFHMSTGVKKTGTYNLKSVIIATAPTKSTVICTNGSVTKTAIEKSGTWTFSGIDDGVWTVKATLGAESTSETVNVNQLDVYRVSLAYTRIYGIARDITASSPAWTRTDDAVGMTATASVGTVAGHSDFDKAYPWSGIKRETLSTGDVMVKIPKFWYKRYRSGNIEHINIADHATSGFALHPAFNHAGKASDFIYVGAYKTSSDTKSKSGVAPGVNLTRATARNNAKGKGAGWGLIDISTLSAVQLLILVEFANNNTQSVIGRGHSSGENTSAIKTGTTNSVPNLTGIPAGTNGIVDVVYRGIEGFWGNVSEYVDGVNWTNFAYWVCNDPSKYADNTSANYTKLSYAISQYTGGSWIAKVGLDPANSHILLPSEIGGSGSTYFCDIYRNSSDWRIAHRGGGWNGEGNGVDAAGLFNFSFLSLASETAANMGSRLMYIP